MGCNCNKTHHIGMGCCVPVLAPIENYYTKYEIDKMLESGSTSGCCITPEEVESAITSAMSIVESEIPSLSGYATEQWVEDKHYITGVDLSDYATKDYVSGFTYDKDTIDNKIAQGGSFDPSQYYDKTTTDALLNEKLDASAYTPIDMSNYDTKSEVNTKISTATGLLHNTLTAHTSDTTIHVTQSDKDAWNSKVDSTTLNNYLLKSKIWCGTQGEYDNILNKDSETLYLIHE